VAYGSETSSLCGASGAACAACATGQQCDTSNGDCVCNATTCPSGCCDGNVCVPYASESPGQCGTGGAACKSCSNGVCDLTAGTCSCDANTCLNGCCEGGTSGTCVLYAAQSSSECGAFGATCSSCGGGSCVTHTDGSGAALSPALGQTFNNCSPLQTWTVAEATDACVAFANSQGGSSADCSAGWECYDPPQPYNVTYVCFSNAAQTECVDYCWAYGNSTEEGQVYGCSCNVVAGNCSTPPYHGCEEEPIPTGDTWE
jgi:hypothetical protein